MAFVGFHIETVKGLVPECVRGAQLTGVDGLDGTRGAVVRRIIDELVLRFQRLWGFVKVLALLEVRTRMGLAS
jgi:hypothetical protein